MQGPFVSFDREGKELREANIVGFFYENQNTNDLKVWFEKHK